MVTCNLLLAAIDKCYSDKPKVDQLIQQGQILAVLSSVPHG